MSAPRDDAKCRKCGGAGWLWWHELDDFSGPAEQTGQDDTRYPCDGCDGPADEEIASQDPSARATAIARGIVEEQLPVILGCAVVGGDLEGARAVLIERIAQAIERAGGGR